MRNKLLIDLGMRIKENLIEEKAARFDEEYSYLLLNRDTSDVWRQFAIWLLVDEEHGVIRFTKPGSEGHRVIQQVADLYIKDCYDFARWEDVRDAAWDALKVAVLSKPINFSSSAVRVAWYAAWYNHYVVYLGDAAYISRAESATEYAAISAAAWSAYYKDDKITVSAEVSKNHYITAYDVHYERMADKMLELIKSAPVTEEEVSRFNFEDVVYPLFGSNNEIEHAKRCEDFYALFNRIDPERKK